MHNFILRIKNKLSEHKYYQKITFLIAGISGVLVQILISIPLYQILNQRDFDLKFISFSFTLKGYVLLGILGVGSGGIANFIINHLYTFNSNSGIWHKRLIKFLPVVALNVLVFTPFFLYVFVDLFNLNKIISFVLNAICLLILNYVIHKFFTFR